MTFTEKVQAVVAKIPKGSVMTYGSVAKKAGKPNAARAVGMIMSHNKDTKAVPCHRVVAANGALTGYAFGGLLMKREMLQKEGVTFRGAKVDLEKSSAKK